MQILCNNTNQISRKSNNIMNNNWTNGGHLEFNSSANEWLEKNGTNSSCKFKGEKIIKSVGEKNIAKIPRALHNHVHDLLN